MTAKGLPSSLHSCGVTARGCTSASLARCMAMATGVMHAWLQACTALVEPTDAFFDKVFVMCEDEGLRRNRLALLRDIAALPAGIINFAQLPGF